MGSVLVEAIVESRPVTRPPVIFLQDDVMKKASLSSPTGFKTIQNFECASDFHVSMP